MPQKQKRKKSQYLVSSTYGDVYGPMTEKQARKELQNLAAEKPGEIVYMSKVVAHATSKPIVTVVG